MRKSTILKVNVSLWTVLNDKINNVQTERIHWFQSVIFQTLYSLDTLFYTCIFYAMYMHLFFFQICSFVYSSNLWLVSVIYIFIQCDVCVCRQGHPILTQEKPVLVDWKEKKKKNRTFLKLTFESYKRTEKIEDSSFVPRWSRLKWWSKPGC